MAADKDSNLSSAKKSALGKGLGSLLEEPGSKKNHAIALSESSNSDQLAVNSNSLVHGLVSQNLGATEQRAVMHVLRLRIDDVEANPHQPRKVFDEEAIETLSASIKEDGVVQPIIVTRAQKPGKYTLIAGERRWRASKKAGLETIPAIVKDAGADAMLRIALIENIQRADLSVVEEAEAYQSLIKDFGLSQEQCAKKVGKDRTTVTNTLRILNLPREIQDDLLEKKLTMGHGRSLLSLEDKKLMLRARDIVIKKNLNVRQTEMLCKRLKHDLDHSSTDPSEQGGAEVVTDADLEYVADALRNHLRTKVRVMGSSGRGRIEISYFSAAELERLVQILGVSLS